MLLHLCFDNPAQPDPEFMSLCQMLWMQIRSTLPIETLHRASSASSSADASEETQGGRRIIRNSRRHHGRQCPSLHTLRHQIGSSKTAPNCLRANSASRTQEKFSHPRVPAPLMTRSRKHRIQSGASRHKNSDVPSADGRTGTHTQTKPGTRKTQTRSSSAKSATIFGHPRRHNHESSQFPAS